jgi:hypothetical protein
MRHCAIKQLFGSLMPTDFCFKLDCSEPDRWALAPSTGQSSRTMTTYSIELNALLSSDLTREAPPLPEW